MLILILVLQSIALLINIFRKLIKILRKAITRPQASKAIIPYLKTINSLSITVYYYLSFMCISPEKKFENINNLPADIQKVKRIEKDIHLTNSKKTIYFIRK